MDRGCVVTDQQAAGQHFFASAVDYFSIEFIFIERTTHCSAVCSSTGKEKAKGRAASGHIDQFYLATVQLQDSVHDPQPQSAIASCAADVERTQKQTFAQLGG